jgi:hypothetical protein
MVQLASRIEPRAALRTLLEGGKVACNGLLMPASAAHHRRLLKPFDRPNLRGMAGQLSVAVVARVICAATEKLDGDDVVRSVPMRATRLRIKRQAAHPWS